MKDSRPARGKRIYQKPCLYPWKTSEGLEHIPRRNRPTGREALPLLPWIGRTLLICGYTQPVERILPFLPQEATWEETERRQRLLKLQESPPQRSSPALFILDFRENDAGESEDWIAGVYGDGNAPHRAAALLLRPSDLAQEKWRPWVTHAWQSSQPLNPKDLAHVLKTFLRLCIPFAQGEARDFDPLCSVG